MKRLDQLGCSAPKKPAVETSVEEAGRVWCSPHQPYTNQLPQTPSAHAATSCGSTECERGPNPACPPGGGYFAGRGVAGRWGLPRTGHARANGLCLGRGFACWPAPGNSPRQTPQPARVHIKPAGFTSNRGSFPPLVQVSSAARREPCPLAWSQMLAAYWRHFYVSSLAS